MKIHEFDPVIYPRKLWVAVSTDTFSDRFEDVSEWDDTADAIVTVFVINCEIWVVFLSDLKVRMPLL
ncbi:hypothetical protein POY81_19285 [Phocaeicola vulgatus]|uniref:hypothetical protein n=1 Tax=Bacteroides caccae TaxID=47678 RepID=UPI00233E970B|nr:hypothetical protein [Phocaeicola vulgatus]MDC1712547.1 hypothetical protein [Phocaeicola vulgatus]MDC1718296.1 hypothetical protein [Phocaeicola vulgatus]